MSSRTVVSAELGDQRDADARGDEALDRARSRRSRTRSAASKPARAQARRSISRLHSQSAARRSTASSARSARRRLRLLRERVVGRRARGNSGSSSRWTCSIDSPPGTLDVVGDSKVSARSSSPLLQLRQRRPRARPATATARPRDGAARNVGDRERHQRRAGRLERRPCAAGRRAGRRSPRARPRPRRAGARIASAWRTSASPGLGQADAARAALDERRPGLALERGDLLRDGGLREGERLRRGGERAAAGRPRAGRACGGRRASAATYTRPCKSSFELIRPASSHWISHRSPARPFQEHAMTTTAVHSPSSVADPSRPWLRRRRARPPRRAGLPAPARAARCSWPRPTARSSPRSRSTTARVIADPFCPPPALVALLELRAGRRRAAARAPRPGRARCGLRPAPRARTA